MRRGACVPYLVDVPLDAKSLTVTVSHPLHQRSHPRVFLQRNTIPVFCASVSGAASGCVDFYDASDSDSLRSAAGTAVWMPAPRSGPRMVHTVFVNLVPGGGAGSADGTGETEGRDVTNVAAELNKREAQWALRGPMGDEGFIEDERPSTEQQRPPSDASEGDGGGGDTASDIDEGYKKRWYIAVHNDIAGQSALTYSLNVEVSSNAECPSAKCSGHGACDAATGVCACDPGFLGRSCGARVIPLEANALSPPSHDEVLAVGEFTFFRFTVNCSGQDMELMLTKNSTFTATSGSSSRDGPDAPADDAGTITGNSTEGDNGTSSVGGGGGGNGGGGDSGGGGGGGGTGSEVEVAIQYGALPTLDDGGFLDGVVAMADEGDTWIDLSNAAPGVYYAVVHVSAGEPLPGFTLRVTLQGSRAPNEFNGCVHADDQLLMDVTVDDGRDQGGCECTRGRLLGWFFPWFPPG